jgi:hypothetical protein
VQREALRQAEHLFQSLLHGAFNQSELELKTMNFDKELELRPKIAWFLNATDWADSRRLVEQYPMLLSDEAAALVETLASKLRQSLPDDAWYFERQCRFLRRCREVGTVKAYDEALRKEKLDY